MSQTKAQLIQPIGIVTAGGIVVTGVVTASSFDGDIVGTATSIISGGNLNLGIVTAVGTGVTASGFSGDFTGTATGIHTGADIKVGSFTASSFVGDFTGTATSMMRGTGFEAGAVNATGFVANVVGNVTGNTTGLAGSVTSGGNIHVGVLTATSYSGDASNMTGIAATNYNTQTVPGSTYSINVTNDGSSAYTLSGTDRNGSVSGNNASVSVEIGDTLNFVVDASGHPFYIRVSDGGANVSTPAATNQGAQSGTVSWTPNTAGTYYYQCGNHAGMIGTITVTATTTIDLSAGNMITFNQEANTTISFANTSTAMDITIIRVKDTSATARTITWPDSVNWNGGSAPTLISKSIAGDSQQFQFLTRDSGLTWYAWENYNRDILSTELWAWAGNDGALGLNDRVRRSSPTQVGTDVNWNELSRTGEHTSATKTDGTLWMWGRNYFGALGLNQSFPGNDRSSPTQVPGTTWSTSAVHYRGVTSTKTDGTLWSWGYNNYGELGLNNRTYLSSPTQVGTDTTWAEVATAGVQVGAATKTDGTLWTWGDNRYGRLGQNITNNIDRSSPVQLPGTTWGTNLKSKVTAAGERVIWVKTDGTLWVWGNNSYGSLGLNQGQSNENNSRSSPTQLPGTTWNTTASCSLAAIATKTDGTLWAWGLNEYGQLAQNHTTTTLSSPVQIPGTTWDTCGMGGFRSLMATKTDGTLWCWGLGNYGQNAQNNNVTYSSPVQVPGTDWSVEGITGTNNSDDHIFAFKKI